jgi:hypothetical protein
MTSLYSRIVASTVLLSALISIPSGLWAQTTAKTSSVDMIVETAGYVHSLFPGKLDPRYQNQVKIVAIPHLYSSTGVELDPKNLYYHWKKNGLVIQADSGYGKQALIMPGEIVPRAYSITVEVWPRDNTVRTKGMTTVDLTEPFITFYVDDPLYGPLFNKAINGTLRIGSEREVSVLAVPFGFNKNPTRSSDLTHSWFINGTLHPELSGNESVILRSPEDSGGSATVQLTMKNLHDILQGATAGFTTIFNSQTEDSDSTTF